MSFQKLHRNISSAKDFQKKYFRQKLFGSKGKRVPDLILGDIVKDQGHIDFLNGSPYFLFQNLIADSKSFLKHYNEIHFHYSVLSTYYETRKLQSSALAPES